MFDFIIPNNYMPYLQIITVLYGTNLISQLIFSGDRNCQLFARISFIFGGCLSSKFFKGSIKCSF